MFGLYFTGGGANAPFYGSFTTNVVVTCEQGSFYGFTADLAYDNSLNVTISGLNGATLTQGSRLVVDTAGVKSGTSVLRLSVSNKTLASGQTAKISLTNVKGTCEGGTSVASAVKTVKYVKPTPVETKPAEPDVVAPDPEVGSLTADELMNISLDTSLKAERREAAKAELLRRLSEAEERLKVLESENAELSQSVEPLGESVEKSDIAQIADNKWVFLGVGAAMASLVAVGIAIIKSLAH
ncbi:MAG: hypothetical protein LBM12_02430 [Candidatus Nomurabacteria bacterium]|jgi:hypothetical protein|nr:hypothetical protein [Candidatus Nomurabacteria bacterium]